MSTVEYKSDPIHEVQPHHLTDVPIDDLPDSKEVKAESGGQVIVSEVKFAEEA
jgi:hypothetical protein